MKKEKTKIMSDALDMSATAEGLYGTSILGNRYNPWASMLAAPMAVCATATALMIAASGQAAGLWLNAADAAFGGLERKPDGHSPAVDALEFLAYSATPEGPLAGDEAPVRKPRKAKPATQSASTAEHLAAPAQIARPASPDDLKLIAGVGPKLETVLNGLGIWTFAQIAALTQEEAAWLDDMLSFPGRIARDGWIAQAEDLAQKLN